MRSLPRHALLFALLASPGQRALAQADTPPAAPAPAPSEPTTPAPAPAEAEGATSAEPSPEGEESERDAGVAEAPEPTPVDPPLPTEAAAHVHAPSSAPPEPHVHPGAAEPHTHEPPAAHEHAHSHVIMHSHEHDSHDPHGVKASYGATARTRQLPRAASAVTIPKRELPRGAHVEAADLVRAAPGVHVVQHAGGGKATQYFLRGFDADHGTDVALFVDGVPVNMVSHGHGQGYADLNWVIPELVQRVEVNKGPYDARFGDFATAGAIELQTSGRSPENRATVEGGMFHSYRGLVIAGTEVQRLRLTAAGEVHGTDGPFDREQNLQRYNLFARAAHSSDLGELSLTATSYGSDWDASGQIPLRLVRAGKLDRFGSVDRNEGGNSTRHSAVLRYQSPVGDAQRFSLLGYLVDYRFSLYSNFTFASEHPESSDMIHQRDNRTLSGFKARYERDDRLGPFSLGSRFGVELRHDRIENGLDHAPAREWAETLVSAHVDETGMAAFLAEDMVWTHWLRTEGAVRVDFMSFAVDDALEDRATEGTKTSGERSATRVSPKASLVLTPIEWLDLYGNFGLGFHSNDARGVVQGVTPMTQALGYEAGMRAKLFDRAVARVALFRMDLDSELVWVGDAGTTESRGRTRREGIEVDLRVNMLSWLYGDLSLSLTRARFRDLPEGEDAVPLAPSRMVSTSVTAQHPVGAYGKIALLHVGDRPATEDSFLTAEGFTRFDLSGGYRYERYELALSLENLFDTSFREAQFGNTSRVPGEDGPSACPGGTRPVSEDGAFLGCEDIHFTPGTPFAVRASASIYF